MKIAVLLIPFLSSLVQEVTKAELTGVARARELSLYNTRNKASADGVFLDDFYVVVCCKFLSILLLQARGDSLLTSLYNLGWPRVLVIVTWPSVAISTLLYLIM